MDFIYSDFSSTFLEVSLRYSVFLSVLLIISKCTPKISSRIRKMILFAGLVSFPAVFFSYIAIPSIERTITIETPQSRIQEVETSAMLSKAQSAEPVRTHSKETEHIAIDPLLAIWLTGLVAFCINIGLGHMQVKRILKRASNISKELKVTQVFETLKQDLNLQSNISVILSKDVKIPFSTGIGTPHIILPDSASEWNDQKLRMVLTHELNHIWERDLLAQALTNAGLALQWFNPIVWLADRQYIIERECICDDAVLGQGHETSDYGQCLIDFAKFEQSVLFQHWATNSMAKKGTLERRLIEMTNSRRNRSGSSRGALLTTFLILAVCIVSIGGVKVSAVTKANVTSDPTLAEPLRNEKTQFQITSHILGFNGPLIGHPSLDSKFRESGNSLVLEPSFRDEILDFANSERFYLMSAPRIIVLNGANAKIQVGQKLHVANYTLRETEIQSDGINQADIGALMSARASLLENGNVKVSVNSVLTSLEGYLKFSKNELRSGYSLNVDPAKTKGSARPEKNSGQHEYIPLIRRIETSTSDVEIKNGSVLAILLQAGEEKTILDYTDSPILEALDLAKLEVSIPPKETESTLFFIEVARLE